MATLDTESRRVCSSRAARASRHRVRRDLDPGRDGADRGGVRGAPRRRRPGAARRRTAPYWALGFACFAAGAAAEAYGASYGWSPVTFRIYYLAGGVLAVGLLGLGAICLHARRDVALLMTGAILATSVAAAVAVLGAGRRCRAAGRGRPAPAAQRGAHRARVPLRDRAQHGRHARAARRHRPLAAAPRAAPRQPPDRRRRARRGEQRDAHPPRRRLRHRARRPARRPRDHLRRLRAGHAARAAAAARRRAPRRSAPDPRA